MKRWPRWLKVVAGVLTFSCLVLSCLVMVNGLLHTAYPDLDAIYWTRNRYLRIEVQK